MSKKPGRKEREKLLNKKPREPVYVCYIYNEYGYIRWLSKSNNGSELGFYSNNSSDAEYVSLGKIEKLKKQYPDLKFF